MRITLTWRKLHTHQIHTQSFDLEKPISIGRSPNNNIVLEDRGVSRYHAAISIEGEKAILRDSSTNGTWMNTQAIKQCELKEDSSFQVMSYRFTILRMEMETVIPSKPIEEIKRPNAIPPSMDLAEIIKKKPYIENLLDLMPDKSVE